MTDNAIETVLLALGLNTQLINNIMDRQDGYGNNVVRFEEIRHHELQFFFPNLYKQNKYWD